MTSTTHIHSNVLMILCVALMSACGGNESETNPVVTPPPQKPAGTLALYVGSPLSAVPGEILTANSAGQAAGGGYKDGVSSAARFAGPAGLVFDSAGYLYVADNDNFILRKIAPDGTVSTVAGQVGVWGHQDGTGPQATFGYVSNLAIDASDNIYVADGTVRKISPDGQVSTVANVTAFSIALDASGTIFLTDNSVIRQIASDGTVSILAGVEGSYGSTDGIGSQSLLFYPGNITYHSGDLYLTDGSGSAIRKFNIASGVLQTLTGAMTGHMDGILAQAKFSGICGLTLDTSGNIYVAERNNHDVRKITTDSIVSTIAGSPLEAGSQDGAGNVANFHGPSGLEFDVAGNLYVSDSIATTIRRISASDGTVSTVAGAPRQCGFKDGSVATARFNGPETMRKDSNGNLFVLDAGNNAIRKISTNGVVSTAFDTNASSFYATSNAFGYLRSFFLDKDANILFSDMFNSIIGKVTPAGEVSILAGTFGASGFADGVGTAALLNFPQGLCVDAVGNIFIVDQYNCAIRKIATNGSVSTVAGIPGTWSNVDGSAVLATFDGPSFIACGPDGSLYVSCNNHTIRKISPDGQSVSTFAGSPGVAGFADGMGPAARFHWPRGLDVDENGNIYVADCGNHTIRKITPDGTVSTIIGVAGLGENQLGTFPASIAFPDGVLVDPSGTGLYISLPDAILKATF